MKFIVSSRVASFTGGVIKLTEDQARTRMHCLKSLGKNRYEITGTVHFKQGEEFDYEGDLPKALAINLTSEAEAEKAAKKAAAEAEKAAKKAAEAEAKAKAEAEAESKKAREKLESDALTAWEGSAELREQHGDNFDAYLAGVLEQLG
jgi:hypothetical protein